jgi:hypothetical protein
VEYDIISINIEEEQMRTRKLLIPVLSLIFSLVACNLPGNQGVIPPTFSVSNQTMTALFSTPLPTIAVTSKPGQALPTFTGQAPATQASVVTQTPSVATLIPTQPPAPTLTSPPAATADLSRRTVTTVIAGYMAVKPKIDGDWNDLPDKEYPAEIVVYGGSNWKDRNDLTASFKIGWDNTNLYIGAKIRDDKYVQNAKGSELFKGDSIEILLDALISDDFYYNQLSPDDFQLGISPGRPNVDGAKEAYLWLPASITGSRGQVVIAATRNESEGITRIEAAIPWSIFAVTPKAGNHYGFAFSVSDNDDAFENTQQKMVSNVKTRNLVDPTTWGDLTLGQ